MKKFYFGVIAALFVISVMGIQTADAAWNFNAQTKNVLVTSNGTNQRAAVNASSNLVYTLAAGESFAQNDTIEVTLTGGAKFNGVAPNRITLTGAAGDDYGAGNGAAATPLSGGGAGQTTALWRVVSATIPTGSNLTFNTNAANIFDLTGVVAGADVDMLITLKTSTGQVIGTASQSVAGVTVPARYLFHGLAAETVAFTAATDQAKVAATGGPFTKFAANAVVGSATALTFTANTGALAVPNQPFSVGKVLITLSGDFNGIAQIAGVGITGSDAAGVADGTFVGKFKINATKDKAYAVNTAAVAANGGALAIAPTFTIDGTTAQPARSFTAKIDVLVDAPVWDAHNAFAETTLYSITRDGVTKAFYNVPQAGNQDKAFLRITNKTGTAGKITATMRNEAGALIGTANTVLIASLAPNETKIVNSDDLTALFGAWTGRARITVVAELTGMEIMGLIRSANGTLTNMSSNVPNGQE